MRDNLPSACGRSVVKVLIPQPRCFGRSIRKLATEAVLKTDEPNKPWEFDPLTYRHFTREVSMQKKGRHMTPM
jgi:hypothetical protein